MNAIDDLHEQHQASLLIQELREEITAIVRAELRNQEGAHRAYVWSIGDPTTTPAPQPPAPFRIELACRPLEVICQCLSAPPASPASFDVHRSLDSGATWETILQFTPHINAGAYTGGGTTFLWERASDRDLANPTTSGYAPITLQAGDLIKLVPTSSGAKSISVQLRVQRIDVNTKQGR